MTASLLRSDEVLAALRAVPTWQFEGGPPSCLVKSWVFARFQDAMHFITQVSELAEQHQHHPDFFNTYTRVRLQLSTHDVGGLSAQDFALAQAIDRLPTPDAPSAQVSVQDAAMATLPAPALEHVCDLAITIAEPIEVGETAQGYRRLIAITGGTVSGPLMQGRVLPGGADFQLLVNAGRQAQLDARYVLELSDGARVFVQNTALRVASAEDSAKIKNGQPVDPSRVYFKCQPRFEAATPTWAWLNEHQFVGVGRRWPDAVQLSFYKVV